MNQRGTWKTEQNGGFCEFAEGDTYDVDRAESLGPIIWRAGGQDAKAPGKPKMETTATNRPSRSLPLSAIRSTYAQAMRI
jgi:hypothetical protein